MRPVPPSARKTEKEFSMSIYAIGDLHLALGEPAKSMEVFPGWQRYMERLEERWRALVAPEDTVVLAGDISWAMGLEETEADFRFLEGLPGRKLLMKGNHDFWWNTRAKVEGFLDRRGLRSLSMLHNNSVEAEGTALCGSRGWLFEGSEKYDPLVVAREAGRIRRPLEAAAPGLEKVLFLHYPPIYGEQVIPEFFDIMEEQGVRECYYGHIHGPGAAGAFQGEHRGVRLRLISADFLHFVPLKIR